MATEMKLLALQSLQNSLHLITMGMQQQKQKQNSIEKLRAMQQAQKQEEEEEEEEEEEDVKVNVRMAQPFTATQQASPPPNSRMSNLDHISSKEGNQENYLSILAQMRAVNKRQESDKESKIFVESKIVNETPILPPSRSPNLTDIKEEPAAKRTQMWLAQLGRYRQKSLQEELDRNHEDLWEEQIARAKLQQQEQKSRGPEVPRSLGPECTDVETIVLDDDNDAGKNAAMAMAAAVHASSFHSAAVLAQPAAAAIKMVPLMSALQVMHKTKPPPSATITRPENDNDVHRHEGDLQQESPQQVYYPQDFMRESGTDYTSQPPPPLPAKKKKMALPLENDLPNPTDEVAKQQGMEKKEEEKEKEKEPESFLKSILMDRMSRKRPSCSDDAYAVKKVAEDSNDILRRRLLGLGDTNYEKSEQKTFAAASYSLQWPRTAAASNNLRLLSIPEVVAKGDARMTKKKEEEKKFEASLSAYARTSVLKHLLHRYTIEGNNEGEGDKATQ
jgi:hypothetical protein